MFPLFPFEKFRNPHKPILLFNQQPLQESQALHWLLLIFQSSSHNCTASSTFWIKPGHTTHNSFCSSFPLFPISPKNPSNLSFKKLQKIQKTIFSQNFILTHQTHLISFSFLHLTLGFFHFQRIPSFTIWAFYQKAKFKRKAMFPNIFHRKSSDQL